MSKDNNEQVVTTFIMNPNTEISISTRRKRKWRGGMIILGSGEKGSFNTPKVLAELSKPAVNLFWGYVAKNINHKNNEVVITPEITEMSSVVLSRANKELIDLGLMMKIKNGLYMLNPRAVFVLEDYASSAEDRWEELKRKKIEVVGKKH